MAVNAHIGQIASAIEAGRRAAASVDYGPIKDLSTINTINLRNIGDFQNNAAPSDLFLFGSHKWGDTSKKVAR
jgi:hypothetical protein